MANSRQEIEAAYTVNEHGIIQSPGKFEGEPVYAPYFWDFYLNGCADDDDGEVLTFNVDENDVALFPELKGIAQVRMAESDQGFVSCETVDA